jgi:hypothetical protein
LKYISAKFNWGWIFHEYSWFCIPLSCKRRSL